MKKNLPEALGADPTLELQAATPNLGQGKVKQLSPIDIRQHNRSGMHQQEERGGTVSPMLSPLGLDPTWRGGSPTPSRSHEFHCRQRVQSLGGHVRVKTLSKTSVDRPVFKLPLPTFVNWKLQQ